MNTLLNEQKSEGAHLSCEDVRPLLIPLIGPVGNTRRPAHLEGPLQLWQRCPGDVDHLPHGYLMTSESKILLMLIRLNTNHIMIL